MDWWVWGERGEAYRMVLVVMLEKEGHSINLDAEARGTVVKD